MRSELKIVFPASRSLLVQEKTRKDRNIPHFPPNAFLTFQSHAAQAESKPLLLPPPNQIPPPSSYPAPHRMGARATGRTLILLGELGDVQSVAPVSLSDMLPTPGVLARSDMEELTGGRRAWVSEGGKQLVLKRRDVRASTLLRHAACSKV